jgi:UDP-N-acetylglucosamine--N-acetylmuramyl-(pentapeptide) pyrophosphoryl-undecaprenol N-acetylglucosamine transferase
MDEKGAMVNVVIVCGGTGGHLFPGLAVGEELLERRHQVLLIVSQKEIDQKALKNSKGFLIQTLPSIGWRGWRPDRAFGFFRMMLKSLKQTKQIFDSFHPNVVLGMGGFSSVAPLIVAWKSKIPSCIHESNAIAGKANRLAGRIASKVALGWERVEKQFPHSETVWTGTPLRAILREPKDLYQARRELEISTDRPTILVMGGSQGAKGLNRLVTETAIKMNPKIQWIHLTGSQDEAMVRESYAKANLTAKVFPFYSEMERLYAAADLAIARSGAASLAEIVQWSLPSILIPFPFAADRHQTANAKILVDAGAALLREESDCTPDILMDEIGDILNNETRRKKMVDATRQMRCEDSHKKLADVVEKLGKTHP